MNALFKTLAALAAAFTLVAPSFATEYKTLDGAKVYDCRASGNATHLKTEVLTEYTAKELRELAAVGLKPTSRTYWAVTTAKKCEDLMVKPAAQTQVKVLGGRPVVLDTKNVKDTVRYYCKDGEVYLFIVTAKNGTSDVPYGGTCQVDPTKTVTLAGL